MVGLLLSAWGLVGKIPHVKMIAVFGLCALVSYGAGNYHATQRAVREEAARVAARDARDQAAQAKALIEHAKAEKAALQRFAVGVAAADKKAHDAFAAGIDSARRDAANTRMALAKEKGTSNDLARLNADLRNVNATLATPLEPAAAPVADPLLCGSGVARRLLDEATGARDRGGPAEGRVAETAAAGVPDAGAEAGPTLTCEQLIQGYVNEGEWGREGWLIVDAWQRWYSTLP